MWEEFDFLLGGYEMGLGPTEFLCLNVVVHFLERRTDFSLEKKNCSAEYALSCFDLIVESQGLVDPLVFREGMLSLLEKGCFSSCSEKPNHWDRLWSFRFSEKFFEFYQNNKSKENLADTEDEEICLDKLKNGAQATLWGKAENYTNQETKELTRPIQDAQEETTEPITGGFSKENKPSAKLHFQYEYADRKAIGVFLKQNLNPENFQPFLDYCNQLTENPTINYPWAFYKKAITSYERVQDFLAIKEREDRKAAIEEARLYKPEPAPTYSSARDKAIEGILSEWLEGHSLTRKRDQQIAIKTEELQPSVTTPEIVPIAEFIQKTVNAKPERNKDEEKYGELQLAIF